MKVLDAGHHYQLSILDGESPTVYHDLQFVKREGPKYPGNVGHYDGTTMQEVLRALIDRAQYVYNQIPCWQTRCAIWLMGFTVWMFEHRAAKRHGRRAPNLHDAVFGKPCSECGHIH